MASSVLYPVSLLKAGLTHLNFAALAGDHDGIVGGSQRTDHCTFILSSARLRSVMSWITPTILVTCPSSSNKSLPRR